MQPTSVTSKGQVTIPKQLRQRLGIRQGTQVEFTLVGNHLEMRVHSSPALQAEGGFGLLKRARKPVPVNFDAASLLKP